MIEPFRVLLVEEEGDVVVKEELMYRHPHDSLVPHGFADIVSVA